MNTRFLISLRRLLKSFSVALLLVLAAASLTNPPAARGAKKRDPDPAELAIGYRDDRILARLKPGAGGVAAAVTRRDATTLVTRLGGSIVGELPGVDGLHVIRTGRGAAGAVIGQLKASGLYAYVEPDWIMRADVQPNDPGLASGELWGLHNTGQDSGTSDADIDAPEAWDIRTAAPGVVVAVVDSGVRYTHEDIAANMWHNPGESGGGKETNHADDDGNGLVDDVFGMDAVNGDGDPMDDNGHGTHCAGTIAGVGNNGLGVAGVAWQTQIMACKFLDDSGSGSTSDAIACIGYARSKGAHILSNSWGGGGYSQALKDAISAARSAGIIFVASAGNSSSDNDLITNYPSNYAVDNIVAVASTSRTDRLSSFSSYGAGYVELAAPGSDILSLGILSDSDYAVKSGTSMAAPHVSGALALLKAQFPADNYRRLINRLQRGTDRVAAIAGKTQTGRLNVAAALSTTASSPYNDSFAAAPLYTGSDIIVRASNAAATTEAGEPIHAGVASAGASLWWRWTASGGGTVNVSTAGSGIDTVLAIYSGASVGSLVAVASNDNESAGTLTSKLVFSATPGTTYSIAVSGKASSSGLVLLQLGAAPVNDHFANAIALTGSPVRVSGSNRNGTKQTGEPNHGGSAGGASVWWSWTAPDSREYAAKTFDSTFDTLLSIYVGSEINSLTAISQNDDFGGATTSMAPFTSVAGTTYYFAVDGKGGATGGISLEITAPPVNDPFANRTSVPQTGGVFSGTNTGASRQTGEPSHGGNSGGASVWWMWTPSVNGPVEINTAGSDFDTLLGVYTGSSEADLTTIADDDDSGDNTQSKVSFDAIGGTPYHIAVDGYGGATGAVSLSILLVTSPPVITSSGTVPGYVGSPFNYTIAATNSPSSFGAAGLPAGLSVDTSTGVISGTPSAKGTWEATISATNGFGTGSARLVITVTEFSAPIAAAMDVPGQPFAGSGAVFWFSQSTTTHDGADAAQSGVITDSESSSMETTVTGPTLLSFWWKVSSEPGYDYLRAFLDGEEIDAVSGETDWVQVTQALSAGPHTIRWTYSKDGSLNEGSDAGWVDQLGTAPITDPPVITSAAAATGSTSALFSYRITATNGPSSFAAGGLPAGLTVNTTTGVISGSTATEGSFKVTISATNSIGTGTAALTITISDFSGAVAEAFDAPGRLFSGSGDELWFAQSATTRDGVDALQSGAIGSDEFTLMETTVTGPIDVIFWWKVSSEPDFDYLSVEVDGIPEDEISGEADWRPKTVSIPNGEHTVSWVYSKDGSVDEGRDAGWVDQLSLAEAVIGSDSFASRPALSGTLPISQGSTVTDGYTREPGEPLHAGRGTASAWWAWTPSASGIYTISTAGSDYDTALAVYEVPPGAGLSGIVPMAMNDNDDGLDQSMVRIHLRAGTACAIAVDGATSGAVVLTISGPASPSGNDNFAAAAVIPAAIPASVTGDNSAASRWDPLESTCRHASLSIL